MRWTWALLATVAVVGCDDGDQSAGDSPQVSALSAGEGPSIEVTATPVVREQNLAAKPDQVKAVRSESGAAAMKFDASTAEHHHHRRHHHRSSEVAKHTTPGKPPWDDSLKHALQEPETQKAPNPAASQPAGPATTSKPPVTNSPPPDVTSGGH